MDLLLEVFMGHWRPPLEVPGDAARLESVSEPGASDLLGVRCPVPCVGRLVQPLFQLSLQLGKKQQCVIGNGNYHIRRQSKPR